MTTYDVRFHETFPAQLTERWDALAAAQGAFFSSSHWMRYTAKEAGVESSYCTAHDEQGELVGAVPFSLCAEQSSDMYRAQEVFKGLDVPWAGTKCQIGSRRGYTADLLVAPDLSAESANRVMVDLVRGAVSVLAERGETSCPLWYLGGDQAVVLHRTGSFSTPLLSCLIGELHLPGSSFQDYLDSLKSHHRRQIRREIKAFESAKLSVEVDELGDVIDEAGPLVAQNMNKYGDAWDAAQGRRSLSRQAALLGSGALAFVCRRQGEMMGVAVGYRWSDHLIIRTTGFDYARLVGAYEYFNTAFYAPVRHAYANGIRRIVLGTAAFQAKALRGARLIPKWTTVFDGGEPRGGSAHAWNSEFLAQLPPGVRADEADRFAERLGS